MPPRNSGASSASGASTPMVITVMHESFTLKMVGVWVAVGAVVLLTLPLGFSMSCHVPVTFPSGS